MFARNRTSVLAGAFLTVTMRWTDRLIGFLSTLILARLLVPADFGIIAMASLVATLVDVLLDLGVNTALIQNREPTQAHYDTAWTLRAMQAVAAGAIVFLSAPFAASYFGDARVGPVLHVMALSVAVAGFENIGIVTFQKEMRFGLDFRYVFTKRIVGFVVTMVAAWLMRSYWALVVGTLAFRSFGVLLSYRMHAMRPRFSLEKFRQIFGITQWVLVNNIGTYLNNSLHKILVGRRTESATMGGYALADEISGMPTTEMLAPLNRVLFPAFVEARNDPQELKRVFLLAQSVQTTLVIPASVGMALVASEAVTVLLGEKWLFAAAFVQLLALANVVQAITTSGWYVMLTLGKARNLALITWVQVLLFVFVAFVLIPGNSALGIAWARVGTVTVGLLLAVGMLLRTLRTVTLFDVAKTVSRPLAAAAAMAMAVHVVGGAVTLPTIAMLALKIGVGAVVYLAAIVSLWLLAGRPTGAEAYVLDRIGRLRRR